MRSILWWAVAASLFSTAAHAQDAGLARPTLILKEPVREMPTANQQEIQVLTATFKPGDRTVFHTHKFPVTVFVLEGTFTLDLEGRPPLVVKAGDAAIEPPNVRMTGYNKSATEPLRVVIFYVSDPDMPFLHVVH